MAYQTYNDIVHVVIQVVDGLEDIIQHWEQIFHEVIDDNLHKYEYDPRWTGIYHSAMPSDWDQSFLRGYRRSRQCDLITKRYHLSTL